MVAASAVDPVWRDPRVRGHHRFYLIGFPSPMGAAKERQEFDMKAPLGAPLIIFPQSYLLMSFPQGDTSERQRVFEIRVFLS